MKEFHNLFISSSALFFGALFLSILATETNPIAPLVLTLSARVALFVAILYILYRLLIGIRFEKVYLAREGFRAVLYTMSWFSVTVLYGLIFLL